MPAALFVTLNVVDAFLTKTALSSGAVEFNPVMAAVGSNIFIKGGLAIALAFLLYYFRQRKALWLLNGLLLCVVLWNLCTCFILDGVSSSYAAFSFPFFG
jgi:glucose dehydrogenase